MRQLEEWLAVPLFER
ncbi:hypothetical protein ACUOCP_28345, partial [Escherichia sp. R-CC3]